MMRDLLKTWSPDALRLYLGMHHYREIWSHDESVLERASQLAHKLHRSVLAAQGDGDPVDPEPALDSFRRAMDQDLDTPAAIQVMEDFAEEILKAVTPGREVEQAQQALRSMGKVLGLQFDAGGSEERVLTGWQEHLKRF
jgi:L-cysteine:1D-myo-inositol 2-amino-2-deoxy-alpha-D-glucopyranoside ligase